MLVCFVALIVFQFSSVLGAQSEKAPSWDGTEWINLSPGEKFWISKILRDVLSISLLKPYESRKMIEEFKRE